MKDLIEQARANIKASVEEPLERIAFLERALNEAIFLADITVQIFPEGESEEDPGLPYTSPPRISCADDNFRASDFPDITEYIRSRSVKEEELGG